MFFTFPISYIYNKSFRLSFHAIPYFILQLLPHYKHRDCCFKILSILHDTNMLPITYLSISITRYCFLPSLSHTFTTSHSDSAFMLYHTSYCSYYLITNIGTVVSKYCIFYMIPICFLLPI